MPSYVSKQFNSGGGGDPVLRDFQHAARAFVDGDFALAPRLKFQHHVVFSTLGGSQADLSVLCKSAETPKVQVTTEVGNQYNKKNIIMTGLSYQAVSFKLYDDNSGVARKLYEGWYKYTFSDHGAAKAGLYGKSLGPPMTSYGLENEPVVPFLNYVKVHTFAKRKWMGYTLINPVIVNWQSDNFDWSSSDPAMHTVQIIYDAVTYDSGNAGPGSPPNFGAAHYDQTPSPLKSGSGGRSPAIGVQGGVLNGAEQITGKELKKADPTNAFKSPLATALSNPESINQYNNTKSLTLNSGGNNPIKSPAKSSIVGRANFNDAVFPVNDSANNSTTAVAKSVTGLSTAATNSFPVR